MFQVNIGGDIAFMNGVIKHWLEMEEEERGSAIDLEFVHNHTTGFEELKAHVEKLEWPQLEEASGISKERMKEFAQLLAQAKTGVFVWSMGLTQHRFGSDNVSASGQSSHAKGIYWSGTLWIDAHSWSQRGARGRRNGRRAHVLARRWSSG